MHGLAKFVTQVEESQMKTDVIPLRVGMTVKVGVTVVEGTKTRVQPYQGLIIAMHKHSLNSTVTVRKTFQGVGVERVFPIHSPLITIAEVETAGVPRVRPKTLRRSPRPPAHASSARSAARSCTTCATAWARRPSCATSSRHACRRLRRPPTPPLLSQRSHSRRVTHRGTTNRDVFLRTHE